MERGMPFFCWERPYRYFEEWMRYSLRPEGLEAEQFAQRFFQSVDELPRTASLFLNQCLNADVCFR
jgi:hypothetical protein